MIIYLAFFLFLSPRFRGAASYFLAITEIVDNLFLAQPRRCGALLMLGSDFLGNVRRKVRLCHVRP